MKRRRESTGVFDPNRDDLEEFCQNINANRKQPQWRHWSVWVWLVLALCFMSLGAVKLHSGADGNGAAEFIEALFLLYFTIAYGAMWRNADQMHTLNRLLLNKLSEERQRAQAAANIRHERNRSRNASALEFYNARTWRTTAEASRAIGEQFKVEPKTAEKWIQGWKKSANASS